MGFTLETVVPWGRSYDEYVDMFDLSEADLGLRILGCGDGPAGFNATLTRRGGTVVSFDPIYAFDAGQIEERIAATFGTVMAEMERNQADYVWEQIASVRELGRLRMEAMRIFLDDFEAGRKEGRYIAGELPAFPFADGSFDLALCSHFLLLYSDHFSAQFHRQAIEAMLRVAREVRIFPVLTLDGRPSPHLEGIVEYFSGLHYDVGLRRVGYEFQRGGNTMLQIQQAPGNVPA
ncbi:MAG: class I SAM-dependent methyltransferase [Desulfobulbus sp.]